MHTRYKDVMLCDVANNEGNDLSVLVGCLKTGFLFLCFLNVIYVELVYIRKLMFSDFTSFGCIILHPVYWFQTIQEELNLNNACQRGNIINTNLIYTKNFNTLLIITWYKIHIFYHIYCVLSIIADTPRYLP